MPPRAAALALIAAACVAVLPGRPAHAEDTASAEEAAKAALRPVCADSAVRDKLVAKIIEQGGEYEQATAKWDLDVACEQIDIPATPVHDTADFADEATHTNWLYDARWSPDGSLVATSGRDGSVRLWDAATGQNVRTIHVAKLPVRVKSDYPGIVRAARFLGDGRLLVVAADAHPVRIFDVASGEPVGEVPYTPADPTSSSAPFIATTTSGLVILGDLGSDLVVYDVQAKAVRYRLPGAVNEFPRFAASVAAGLLATAFPGGERSVVVRLYKLETGELVRQATAEGDRSASSLAFSRDGSKLAVAIRGKAHIYGVDDMALNSTVVVYPTFGDFDVTFTADETGLISGRRHAELWNIATGERVRHFGPFSDLCHSVDVSPDGKHLVTGHIGSDGRIWEIETGSFFRRLGKNVHPPG